MEFPHESRLPEPWKHVSGYRLDADGLTIDYSHPNGNKISVEAFIEQTPDGDQMEYLIDVRNSDGESLIGGPEVAIEKDRAFEVARKLATEHGVSRADELHSHVIGLVDSSGGDFRTAFDYINSAENAGYDVDTLLAHIEEADDYLGEAMEVVDTTDPDPDEAFDLIQSARKTVERAYNSMPSDLREFDSDDNLRTLGGYIEWLYKSLLGMEDTADEWASEAQ